MLDGSGADEAERAEIDGDGSKLIIVCWIVLVLTELKELRLKVMGVN